MTSKSHLKMVSNTSVPTGPKPKTRTTKKSTTKVAVDPKAAQPVTPAVVDETTVTTEEVKTGGGKGGGGPDEPFFTRSELKSFVTYVVLPVLAGIGVALLLWATVTANGKIKEIVDAPTATRTADAVTPKVQPPAVSAPVVPTRNTVVYGSFFDCSTISGKDANVKNAVIQHVHAGQSLHIPQSCALVHADTLVSEFNARKYKLWVSLLNISGNEYRSDTDIYNPYDTCGDTNGNNDRPPQCIDFINRYSKEGKDILVVIEQGGFVNIN